MQPRYWFPAKTYGWGWGLPATWEGWVVLAAFVALMVASAILFPPGNAPAPFFVAVAVLSTLLLAICWLTGEPPRWRWGKK